MTILTECNLASFVVELLAGKTAVFPTETSYGLGCDATNQAAADKIFAIKGRPSDKPLLIVVPDVATAKKYIRWNSLLEQIATKCWPGPLTVVGEVNTDSLGKNLAKGVVAKDGTVAVRVTANPLLQSITQKIGRPLVATSANITGAGDSYDSSVVIEAFENQAAQPDIILHQGVLPTRPPTTIVSVVGNTFKILRQGAVEISISTKPSGLSARMIVLLIAALVSACVMLFAWQSAQTEMNNIKESLLTTTPHAILPTARTKPPAQVAKGVYLTAYSAGNPKKLDEIIQLINTTELNAVVIDIKDYSGNVLYDSKLQLVNDFKLKDNRLHGLAGIVRKLHDNHIYVIARQTVMQDPILARAKPEWAIRNKSGGIWHDHKGLSWVDPTKKEVWKYNVAIAREAAKFGFDEINFDYVRFPSDGDMSTVAYSNGASKKYEVMQNFYHYLSTQLADEPVWISLDMFGFVMEKHGEDDMSIGQRLADAVHNTDYICPMMYPSHYPPGHLGLKNPAQFPELVFRSGLTKGAPAFVDVRAKLRPWIQAFNLGAVYDATKIRAQIDEIEKFDNAGWLMWNASNRYTNAGLKAE